jgi:hypothetical protein
MKNLKNFKKFNESVSNVTIDINLKDADERSPLKKDPIYDVIYSFNLNSELLELSGYLTKGPSGNYEFDPSWFSDNEAENYYDDNWDKIEEEILQKFYETYKNI